MTIKVQIQNLDSETLFVDVEGENITYRFAPNEVGVIYIYKDHGAALRVDSRQPRMISDDRRAFRPRRTAIESARDAAGNRSSNGS